MQRLSLLLLLGTTAALACEPVDITQPPAGYGSANDPFTTLERNPVLPVHLGVLVVALEKTTLAEVQRAAGVGEVHRHADASDSLHWLCYSLPATNDRVWFTASEMDGGTVIDGVIAQHYTYGLPAWVGCPALPAALLPLRFGDGFALGATPEQAMRAFGPSKPGVADWHYLYEGSAGGGFVLNAEASVHFTDGRVSGVRLSQGTSN